MTAEQFAMLVKARHHHGYWTARCPAHSDRTPSLSIRKGKAGKVMIRCFSGCETIEVLKALGLSYADLYLDADREAWLQKKREAERRCPSIKQKIERKPLGKLEATYRYTNKNGNVVAEKLRYEGKVFLWRQPKIGGGWDWKVNRNNLPIYRLHEVLSSPLVFLCEGEKDADAMRNLCRPKAAATTAPNGAKSWKSEYRSCFAGRKVIILPDSDTPGREYGKQALRDIRPIARCAFVISVSPCKDVSDFLAQHTASELSQKIRAVLT
jgi:putative DNA primase/helicase